MNFLLKRIACCGVHTRVVIPSRLREAIVKELHKGHPGVTRMKAIAQSHLWWPGLDKDLEKATHAYVSCQAVKQAPDMEQLHPWVWPSHPWQCIHIDFSGPFWGEMYLLVINAHSKRGEVFQMTEYHCYQDLRDFASTFFSIRITRASSI